MAPKILEKLTGMLFSILMYCYNSSIWFSEEMASIISYQNCAKNGQNESKLLDEILVVQFDRFVS